MKQRLYDNGLQAECTTLVTEQVSEDIEYTRHVPDAHLAPVIGSTMPPSMLRSATEALGDAIKSQPRLYTCENHRDWSPSLRYVGGRADRIVEVEAARLLHAALGCAD